MHSRCDQQTIQVLLNIYAEVMIGLNIVDRVKRGCCKK
jgi:hypothetical protein